MLVQKNKESFFILKNNNNKMKTGGGLRQNEKNDIITNMGTHVNQNSYENSCARGFEAEIMWAMTTYVKSWLFNKLPTRVSPISYWHVVKG